LATHIKAEKKAKRQDLRDGTISKSDLLFPAASQQPGSRDFDIEMLLRPIKSKKKS